MKNLSLDMYFVKDHAQTYIENLGIKYKFYTPQSSIDAWWFWDCTNVPNPLPEGITELNENPDKWIQNGQHNN